jgi:hypothetical protein
MTSAQEMLRTEAQQQAGTPLDPDAITAIVETRKALDAINQQKVDEALAAIERAVGKIDVLVARNPGAATLPVNKEVVIFDTAPDDIEHIHELGLAAETATDIGDYPGARVILYGMMSEIRVHLHNIPLAAYTSALATAARFLQDKRNDDAVAVLSTALATLVVTDRIIPIPMLVAREAMREAEAQVDKDKQRASRFVEEARQELVRAEELGYAMGDPDYKTLNDQLTDVQKKLKGDQETSSLFGKIRERMASLLNRQSQREYSQSEAKKQQAQEPERKVA